VQYLETLCTLLDKACSQVFSYELLHHQPNASDTIARLLHFALPDDLEDLMVNLRFYEVIFSTLEEYEICGNIAFLQQKVRAEINRKATS
jgi:hypothetical protein